MQVNLKFDKPDDKWAVLRQIKDELIMKNGLVMDDVDEHKPWGAYYRLSPGQDDKFLSLFFPDVDRNHFSTSISPKIMVFAPGQKVSMQYHERRDEMWTVLQGEIEAWYGTEDRLGDYTKYEPGQTYSYPAGYRHKAGASDKGWSIIAEIWKHSDPSAPSAEEDNVRLADDYGRA